MTQHRSERQRRVDRSRGRLRGSRIDVFLRAHRLWVLLLFGVVVTGLGLETGSEAVQYAGVAAFWLAFTILCMRSFKRGWRRIVGWWARPMQDSQPSSTSDARLARGRTGELRVRDVIDGMELRGAYVAHGVELPSGGDIDHVIVDQQNRFVIVIETKAERPAIAHLKQVQREAEHASRVLFGSWPTYRIVVYPNSDEPLTYEPSYNAYRTGLPSLRGLIDELLDRQWPSSRE